MRLVRPWLIEGRAEIPGATGDKEVLKRLAKRLSDQYKLATWHPDDTMTFVDYGAPHKSWPALALFNSGRVWIERGPRAAWLRYRLSLGFAFVFAVGAAILAFAFFAYVGAPIAGAKAGGLCLAVLYGLNLLVAALRANYFFDNVARNFDPTD